MPREFASLCLHDFRYEVKAIMISAPLIRETVYVLNSDANVRVDWKNYRAS